MKSRRVPQPRLWLSLPLPLPVDSQTDVLLFLPDLEEDCLLRHDERDPSSWNKDLHSTERVMRGGLSGSNNSSWDPVERLSVLALTRRGGTESESGRRISLVYPSLQMFLFVSVLPNAFVIPGSLGPGTTTILPSSETVHLWSALVSFGVNIQDSDGRRANNIPTFSPR